MGIPPAPREPAAFVDPTRSGSSEHHVNHLNRRGRRMRTGHARKCSIASCRFTFFPRFPQRLNGLEHESTCGTQDRLGASDLDLDGGMIPERLRCADGLFGSRHLRQIINRCPGNAERHAEDRGIENGHQSEPVEHAFLHRCRRHCVDRTFSGHVKIGYAKVVAPASDRETMFYRWIKSDNATVLFFGLTVAERTVANPPTADLPCKSPRYLHQPWSLMPLGFPDP